MGKISRILLGTVIVSSIGGTIPLLFTPDETVRADNFMTTYTAPSKEDADNGKGLDQITYIQQHLTNKKVQKPTIPVSDSRLKNVQNFFSTLVQPFEYGMKYDSSTGNATYSNGYVISEEARVTSRPVKKDGSFVGPADDQIPPLVRTLTAQLVDVTKQGYSDKTVFDIIERANELEQFTDRLNFPEVTGILIELNSSIRNDRDSYNKAVGIIQELNRLVNADKS
ncbi:hypothetical protein [Aneurinibacillus terranovensis]|uniref:hypothetical protein n=1 Tax=Aneurinibacillus terranovensis TaxID=278991 RepID=UPI00041A12A0|nr:hypothetical protein [Aneurinibacillus terranovensis]